MKLQTSLGWSGQLMINTSKLGFIFHQILTDITKRVICKHLFFLFSEKQHCHNDASYNLNRPCKHFITFTRHTATFYPLFSQESRTVPKTFLRFIFLAPVPCGSMFEMITPTLSLWCKAVQWGMNSCIHLFFFVFGLCFVIYCLVSFFTLIFFCTVRLVFHQKWYSCHNIEIYIWQVYTLHDEP